MLCKECGTENIDRALFCVGCGKKLSQPEPIMPPAREDGPQTVKKAPWTLIAAAAAVILVLILCIALLAGGGEAYEEAAETFVVALFQNDRNTLSEVLQPQLYEYLKSADFFEKEAVPCEAEAIGAEPCTETDLEGLRTLYSLLGAKGNFTNAHRVEVEYTIVYGSKETTSIANITVSEIDGEWTVVGVE